MFTVMPNEKKPPGRLLENLPGEVGGYIPIRLDPEYACAGILTGVDPTTPENVIICLSQTGRAGDPAPFIGLNAEGARGLADTLRVLADMSEKLLAERA